LIKREIITTARSVGSLSTDKTLKADRRIRDRKKQHLCIGQTHAAHPSPAARRPKGLGLHYEAQHPVGTRWAGNVQHLSDHYKKAASPLARGWAAFCQPAALPV